MRVQLSLLDNKGLIFILPEEVIQVLDKADGCCYIKCRDGSRQAVVGCAEDVNRILTEEELKQEMIRISRQEVARISYEQSNVWRKPGKEASEQLPK